jgi:hypothetical protein
VARITAAKAGEEGEDEDGEGNWRWYCNKLLKQRNLRLLCRRKFTI